MAEWFRKRQGYDPNSSVPTKIPKEVMDRFTKNGLIQLVEVVVLKFTYQISESRQEQV